MKDFRIKESQRNSLWFPCRPNKPDPPFQLASDHFDRAYSLSSSRL